MPLPGCADQMPEQPACQRRLRRPRKARPRAAPGVGGEGELWHQQQAAADLGQAEVHPASLVREHAQDQQAFQQSVGFGFGIAGLGAHQHQQAVADRAAVDIDLGRGYPLQQADHRRSRQTGNTATAARLSHTVPTLHRDT